MLSMIHAERKVSFLGYKINLTDSEYAIVAYLAGKGERGASRVELCELSGSSSLNVHICNINKKFGSVSGRKFIIFGNKTYKINDNM